MYTLCVTHTERQNLQKITSPNINPSDAYNALFVIHFQKSIYVGNTLFCKASHIILNKPLACPGLNFSLSCSYWIGIFCLSFHEEKIRCFKQRQFLELLERKKENLNRNQFFYICIYDNQILLVDNAPRHF